MFTFQIPKILPITTKNSAIIVLRNLRGRYKIYKSFYNSTLELFLHTANSITSKVSKTSKTYFFPKTLKFYKTSIISRCFITKKSFYSRLVFQVFLIFFNVFRNCQGGMLFSTFGTYKLPIILPIKTIKSFIMPL